MSPTAGRTARDPRPAETRARRSPLAAIGALAAVCALTLSLTSCGGGAQAADAVRSADVASWTDARAGVEALVRQADAQHAAVTEAARARAADAAERNAAGQAEQARRAQQAEQAQQADRPTESAASEQCTTRPEDRAACTLPEGAEITPGGGDVDGDGVFEEHEPVGPGYKDPRAYDGGPTSGEVQCEWLRTQGHDC